MVILSPHVVALALVWWYALVVVKHCTVRTPTAGSTAGVAVQRQGMEAVSAGERAVVVADIINER